MGSPITPFFYDWAWNVPRGKEIAKKWNFIPEDTDVLITHGPPYGILDVVPSDYRAFGEDLHVGCEELRKRIDAIPSIKAHIFGHIHHSYGHAFIRNINYVNASSCNEKYQLENSPIIIEINK